MKKFENVPDLHAALSKLAMSLEYLDGPDGGRWIPCDTCHSVYLDSGQIVSGQCAECFSKLHGEE